MKFKNRIKTLKKPIKISLIKKFCLSLHSQTSDGVIAQLVEQRTENPCVPGSIPGDTTRTKVKSLKINDFFFCPYSICPKYVRKSFTILTFIIFTSIIGPIWFYFTSTINPSHFGQIFKIRVRKILRKMINRHISYSDL